MDGIYVQTPEKSLWVSLLNLIKFSFIEDGIVVEYFPDAKRQRPRKFIASLDIVLFRTYAEETTIWIDSYTLIPRTNLRFIEDDPGITNFSYLNGDSIQTSGIKGTPPNYLRDILIKDRLTQLWPEPETNSNVN